MDIQTENKVFYVGQTVIWKNKIVGEVVSVVQKKERDPRYTIKTYRGVLRNAWANELEQV